MVAQVPSTIFEHPVIEENAGSNTEECTKTNSLSRSDVESIRVYAGDDVYALLADVEDEITRMSKTINNPIPEEDLPEPKRTELHRQKSHEMLNGLTDGCTTKQNPQLTRPLTPPAPTPPLKSDPPPEEGLILLTSAVFKP